MAKQLVPPELQDEIYRQYLEDPSLRTTTIAQWLKETHSIKVDSATVSNIIRRYQTLREKEMREHIKDKVAPFIAKDLERQQRTNTMLANAIAATYVECFNNKNFKLIPHFARLINEQRQNHAFDAQLCGAYTQEKSVDSDSYTEEAVSKIMSHIEKQVAESKKGN
jgi:hypothetical protein